MNNKTLKVVLAAAAVVVLAVACWLLFGNKGGQRTNPTTTAQVTEAPQTTGSQQAQAETTAAPTTTTAAPATTTAAPAETTETVDGHITITVQDENSKMLAEKSVGYKAGQSLAELLEANFENVTIDNSMLMTIESLTTPADWHTYIGLFINGEYAMEGVMTLPFKDGDKIDLINTVYIPMEETTAEAEAFDGYITITVQDLDNKMLAEKKVGFKAGQSLAELLEANFENVTIDNSMLMTIESLTTPADWSTYISLLINGEYAMEGVMTLPFKDGDTIDLVNTKYIPQ